MNPLKRIIISSVIITTLVGIACAASPKTTNPAPIQSETTVLAAPTALTSFGDGTYEVAKSAVPGRIVPGVYKTVVPAKSVGCYWERLKDTNWELTSIIAIENVGAGPERGRNAR